MTSDRTLVVVRQQTEAMACELFEVGVQAGVCAGLPW